MTGHRQKREKPENQECLEAQALPVVLPGCLWVAALIVELPAHQEAWVLPFEYTLEREEALDVL